MYSNTECAHRTGSIVPLYTSRTSTEKVFRWRTYARDRTEPFGASIYVHRKSLLCMYIILCWQTVVLARPQIRVLCVCTYVNRTRSFGAYIIYINRKKTSVHVYYMSIEQSHSCHCNRPQTNSGPYRYIHVNIYL